MTTTMVSLMEFLPRVMPFVPGCAEPTAEQYVREAAIEFCRRTKAWREADEFDITPTTLELVCVPPYADLHEIEDMRFDGRPLKAVSWPTVWRDHGAGPPRTFSQVGLNGIRIDPPGTGKLQVSMFLKPSDKADYLPDILLHHFAQVIADGALARILMLPDKPYTNPQSAAAFGAAFQGQCDSNFDLSTRGQQRAPARVRASFL